MGDRLGKRIFLFVLCFFFGRFERGVIVCDIIRRIFGVFMFGDFFVEFFWVRV